MNTAIETYGTNQELQSMAGRFKTALRGGDKLSNNEAMALAQIARITNLNPFIGELWYIPGKGPMIGIAGARRLWNEKSSLGGGWSHVDISPCSPEEAGATEKDVVVAFRAEAHDSKATADYQRLFVETLAACRASGSTDPFKDAKEIMGNKPVWVGYGYSTQSETSRMNKTQLARKRAEADALKKCISVPFGVEISVDGDTAPAYESQVVTGSVVEESLQELPIESAQPAPKLKPNETITDDEWQAFEKLCADATGKGINLPIYNRAKMKPDTLNGAKKYIEQQITKKAGK